MREKVAVADMSILEAVNAAIIMTDVAGIITYWNPYAERLYGWTSKEVVGQSIMSITVGSESAEQAAQHMASLHAGNSWSGEFSVRCKNGEFLPALVTLSPLFDELGATSGIVGISQDLRERKQAEDKLHEARAELERRVAKGQKNSRCK
jgi:PAS domain S-box